MGAGNQYHDLDIYGREYSNGNPYEFFDEDAIKNALTFFLTMKRGDILYRPDLGGLMDNALFKNMSNASLEKQIFLVRNALNNYFVPAIQLRGIQFNPLYEQRALEINISYTNPATRVLEQLKIYTKNPSNIKPKTIEDVVYTGENLRMFCLVKKPDMGKNIMYYNNDLDSWVWGSEFKFSNLTTSDTYFSDIQNICNG
jgi:phage baseplate assembly protein W